mmetsp:Transcript_61196/g.162651  ORF Transcript_61196/g.162651 Transcript_61196/m.162651 type:complete len:224 (-) Transcript_61196:661-1332(-)
MCWPCARIAFRSRSPASAAGWWHPEAPPTPRGGKTRVSMSCITAHEKMRSTVSATEAFSAMRAYCPWWSLRGCLRRAAQITSTRGGSASHAPPSDRGPRRMLTSDVWTIASSSARFGSPWRCLGISCRACRYVVRRNSCASRKSARTGCPEYWSPIAVKRTRATLGFRGSDATARHMSIGPMSCDSVSSGGPSSRGLTPSMLPSVRKIRDIGTRISSQTTLSA